MAEAEILLEKRVQDRVNNGEIPASLYVSRDAKELAQNILFQLAPIPIIDIGLFSSSSATIIEKENELQKLKSALCSWGCFQATGHGIPTTFLEKIRQVSREFFQQPMEERVKCSKRVDEMQGYGGDPTPEQGQFLDWQDRLFLEVDPEEVKKLEFWPENPKTFRQVLEDYTTKMKMITERVSIAMAQSLQLEENCFQNQLGKQAILQARFNYYSRCERPEMVLGLKPHGDGSAYTIILQDDVEGLQVLKGEQWFTVPAISNALLVLMGDQMEIMTNGIFKSPLHRVVSNSDKDRYSIAMFLYPERSKEIGPEEGLINEEKPRVFKKVEDYGVVHWGYYQQGKRALHVAQV